jgi:hypothetical protein
MKLTATYSGTFTIADPTTGDAINADSLPTATAFKNGVTNAISLTVANISTGHYLVTSAATFGASGFAVDDKVDILVSATVLTIAAKAIIHKFILDTVTAKLDEIDVDISVNAAAIVDIGNTTDAIKTQTDKLDNMIDEDSSGNAFTTIALANGTAEVDPDSLEDAMLAVTGITVGGTWTWAKIMKIAAAYAAGNWRVKETDPTKQELLDAEDADTVILEQSITRSPSAGSNYRDITVKI